MITCFTRILWAIVRASYIFVHLKQQMSLILASQILAKIWEVSGEQVAELISHPSLDFLSILYIVLLRVAHPLSTVQFLYRSHCPTIRICHEKLLCSHIDLCCSHIDSNEEWTHDRSLFSSYTLRVSQCSVLHCLLFSIYLSPWMNSSSPKILNNTSMPKTSKFKFTALTFHLSSRLVLMDISI